MKRVNYSENSPAVFDHSLEVMRYLYCHNFNGNVVIFLITVMNLIITFYILNIFFISVYSIFNLRLVFIVRCYI